MKYFIAEYSNTSGELTRRIEVAENKASAITQGDIFIDTYALFYGDIDDFDIPNCDDEKFSYCLERDRS